MVHNKIIILKKDEVTWDISPNSGSCVFSREGPISCHKVFLRVYFPLALEVCNCLFIDDVGFMTADNI